MVIPIVWVKNAAENIDLIFPKTADQTYLVKIVLIMQNKCSHGDIAHSSVNLVHSNIESM